MIIQTYIIGKEVYQIIIDKDKVLYSDRKLPKPIQLIPTDDRIKKLILLSRNRINNQLVNSFKLTKEEQDEYDYAVKDKLNMEKRLAEICKKDALSQRSKLIDEKIE